MSGFIRGFFAAGAVLGPLFVASVASAAATMGAPPPEADKIAKETAKPRDALKLEGAPEGLTASMSAGGMSVTGNSKLLAFTGSGLFDARYGDNGYGASLVGNYGRSAPPDG